MRRHKTCMPRLRPALDAKGLRQWISSRVGSLSLSRELLVTLTPMRQSVCSQAPPTILLHQMATSITVQRMLGGEAVVQQVPGEAETSFRPSKTEQWRKATLDSLNGTDRLLKLWREAFRFLYLGMRSSSENYFATWLVFMQQVGVGKAL